MTYSAKCKIVLSLGVLVLLTAVALLVIGWFDRTPNGAGAILSGLLIAFPGFLMVVIPIDELRNNHE